MKAQITVRVANAARRTITRENAAAVREVAWFLFGPKPTGYDQMWRKA